MRSDILLFDSGPTTETALYWAIGNRSIHLETVRTVDEAMSYLERCCVDVLICDDEKAGEAWLDLLVKTASLHTSVISIVTARCASMDILVRSINQGRVFAFLPKPLDRDDLKRTVHEALTRSLTSFAMRRALEIAAQGPHPQYRPPVPTAPEPESQPGVVHLSRDPFGSLPGDLSLREWEVLALLSDGLTTRQIAKRLFISVYTVRNHLKSMYRKLELHSQSELIDWHQASRPQLAAG